MTVDNIDNLFNISSWLWRLSWNDIIRKLKNGLTIYYLGMRKRNNLFLQANNRKGIFFFKRTL